MLLQSIMTFAPEIPVYWYECIRVGFTLIHCVMLLSLDLEDIDIILILHTQSYIWHFCQNGSRSVGKHAMMLCVSLYCFVSYCCFMR